MPKVRDDEDDYRPRALMYDEHGNPVRISSVLFGITMLVAIVVATAAWMGGSLSQIENKFAGFMDNSARSMGISVQDVSVLGLQQDPLLARDVRDAAMIEPGENMFRADPHLIKRRIESTKKVLNVRVHRLWPDQIVILADAAEPVAQWHDGEKWTVIDGLGRIMPDVYAEDYNHLVRLAGRGAPDAAPQLVEALADTPELSAKIAIASRVSDRRWDLRAVSGTSIRLPDDDDLAAALTRLERLELTRRLSERDLATVDMRSEGRIYLSPNARRVSPETEPNQS